MPDINIGKKLNAPINNLAYAQKNLYFCIINITPFWKVELFESEAN